MTKWTEDITYKFVQEYLKHECLYNCKFPNNKMKVARHSALFLRISEAMNIPGFGGKEVYAKIRNLKSTYLQEVKKIKQSAESGADPVYNPQMKWFKLLDDALKNVQNKDSQSIKGLYDKHEILDGAAPSPSQHNQSAEKNNPDATPDPKRNHDEEGNGKSPIPRKMILLDLNRLVNKLQNVADTINTPSQTETEFDVFGKSLAAQLNSMPMHQAIEAQMFIQNYLCHLRLRQMGHEPSNDAYIPLPSFKYQSPSPTYGKTPSPLQNSPDPLS